MPSDLKLSMRAISHFPLSPAERGVTMTCSPERMGRDHSTTTLLGEKVQNTDLPLHSHHCGQTRFFQEMGTIGSGLLTTHLKKAQQSAPCHSAGKGYKFSEGRFGNVHPRHRCLHFWFSDSTTGTYPQRYSHGLKMRDVGNALGHWL